MEYCCTITYMDLQNSVMKKLSGKLESISKYKVDDRINKNLIAEDARKYDGRLLNELQKDDELKNHFFVETEGGLVFKKDVFLQFINNKEFLPDSYTKYKIKIGLGSDDGSLLSEDGNIVLNWPYKDTILEGGQDKEDQKRKEVFFNEVLAPDQITRLLDDKVFTNWKRYDKNGEHNLDELKYDDNLIIKGNNLVVLHSLKKRYAGKVKLIYIDPPYNTGNDSFGYNDRFNHSTWLTFMKNRLEVAKDMMRDDGFIFVHCDDNEQQYLKVLMDEIFGVNKFEGLITVKANPAGKQSGSSLAVMADYMLVYSKSSQAKLNGLPLDDKLTSQYNQEDEKGKFLIGRLRQHGVAERREDSPTLYFPIYYNKSSGEIDVEKQNGENWIEVYPILPSGGDGRWIWSKRRITADKDKVVVKQIKRNGELIWDAYYKKYLTDDLRRKTPTVWDDKKYRNENGTKELRKLYGHKGTFSYPKPEFTIQDVLECSTAVGDLVLDYHLGSGTTAAVAHKMGRKYVGVEQLFYGDNDPVERLKQVIEGEDTGISETVNWQGGGSFVYCNILNNVNKFRKKVESAKDDKDYEILLEEAASSSFLSYRVDPTKLNDAEFRKLSKAEKRQVLLELIDNNTLYVNYEDINDPVFRITPEDKKHNKKLYEKQ
jgi:adenine-specific DNA-methyltransferase